MKERMQPRQQLWWGWHHHDVWCCLRADCECIMQDDGGCLLRVAMERSVSGVRVCQTTTTSTTTTRESSQHTIYQGHGKLVGNAAATTTIYCHNEELMATDESEVIPLVSYSHSNPIVIQSACIRLSVNIFLLLCIQCKFFPLIQTIKFLGWYLPFLFHPLFFLYLIFHIFIFSLSLLIHVV